MNDFEIAKTILNKIISEDITFSAALKSVYKKYNVAPNSRSNISALLGCELRHHYLLDNLIKRYINDVDFDSTVYLRFLITNKLFLKRFNDSELYALAVKNLDKEQVDKLLEFVSSTKEIIPEDMDKTSPEYLSLRFNTPAWVIRMWQKQYGKGLVFKVLKANYRSSIQTVRVNNQLTTSFELLDKRSDFNLSLVEDILVYTGKGSPKALEEFKQGKIFQMRMATKYVIDRMEAEPIKGIAIYSDVNNNIVFDLIARFGNNVKVDYVNNHVQSFYENKKVIEERGYNGIAQYNASSSSIITCISRPVDSVFCLCKGTSFDSLRSAPDYFLRIKQEKLDSIIKEELDALSECSKIVERDGKLVYMVPTLSKKESTNLIAKFLTDHEDFELVEEKQFFPFDPYDSCLYYAIIKRKSE